MTKTTSFKRVHSRNFMFSYTNIQNQMVPDIVKDILDSFGPWKVLEYCFSLDLDSVLSVYIKVLRKIDICSSKPKLLRIKSTNQDPIHIISVLNPTETIGILYENDINKGKFFSNNLKEIITKLYTSDKKYKSLIRCPCK